MLFVKLATADFLALMFCKVKDELKKFMIICDGSFMIAPIGAALGVPSLLYVEMMVSAIMPLWKPSSVKSTIISPSC
jgi:hypothetical protein